MKNRLPILALPLAAACASPPSGAAPSRDDAAIRAEDVQAHVDYLASDDLGGRSSRDRGGIDAAAYVAGRFAAFGLEPAAPGGGWYHAFDPQLAPNVVGRVEGREESVLVLSAHFDHLGTRPGGPPGADRVFNGADDNASGTAALLELAEVFAAAEEPPGPTLLFVAFSAEEEGLLGSRAFVEALPFPGDLLLGNVNLDMVSRGREDLIFLESGGGAELLLEATLRANAALGELEVRVGVHPEWLRQSDQAAFLDAGFPALYLGVEDHEDYHRVTDHADRILPELAARVARLVERAVRELDETAPGV